MKHTTLYFLSALVLCTSVQQVNAADFRFAESLTLSDQVLEDSIFAAESIILNEGVDGDAILFGGDVTAKGVTTEDLMILAGNTSVSGTVGDDVRIAGGDVTLNAEVDDDVFIAGGKVTLSESAKVNGDVSIAAGDVYLDGVLVGDVTVRAGRVIINGSVLGNLDVHAEDISVYGSVQGTSLLVAEEISTGSETLFEDTVTYYREEGRMDFASSLSDGVEAQYAPKYASEDHSDKWKQKKHHGKKWMKIFFLKVFALSTAFAVLVILLGTYLFPKFFVEAAKKLKKSFWKSALYGMLYFILLPIVSVLLMITVIGIPFSILGIISYAFSFVFAAPLAALVVGKYLEAKYKKSWKPWMYVLICTGIYVIIELLLFIPLIGWLAKCILICAVFGAVIQVKSEIWKKFR